MRTNRDHAVPLAGAGLAVAVLVGCGNPFDASELEEAEQGQAGPPSFGEIRGQLFDTMLQAESVTITGQVEAGEADLDDLFDGIEEGEDGELSISGALDGSNSEMSFSAGGSSFTQLAVEGEEYFRGEDFAALLIGELDEDIAEEVSEEFIDETVADSWVQFTEGGDGSIFSAEDFITTWQQELEEDDVDQLTAEVSEQEGEEVWVYTDEDGELELTVTAAEDEPYLLSVRDEESSYEFSEWNSSEPPEEPESVITLDELFEAIAEDQGWPTEDLEGDAEDDLAEDDIDEEDDQEDNDD